MKERKKFRFEKVSRLGLLPEHKKEEDYNKWLLSWFIGFFEADGSFEKDGRVNITQGSGDIQVLHRLRTAMGFGNVVSDNIVGVTSKGTHRWRTKGGDVRVAARLAIILNGNLVTGKKLEDFGVWYRYHCRKALFKKLVGPDFVLQTERNKGLISLENRWLAGFIDGEGCFSISLSLRDNKKDLKGFKVNRTIRVMVASQGDPLWVSDVIEVLGMGRRDPKNSRLNQKWTVSKKEEVDKVIEYIENFSLWTKKSISFIKFCKVRRRIYKNEDRLTLSGFESVKIEASKINQDHGCLGQDM